MRKAFIGLSTPLFYDYKNQATKTKKDTNSSPNPVLDSPFGLFLLYDEIWFLTRSLCPENMRNLPYVKYVDENFSIDFSDILYQINSAENYSYENEKVKNYYRSFDVYSETLRNVGVHWDHGCDNHTHGILLDQINVNGNSVSIDNVIFDMNVSNQLGEKFEFITNSFTQRLFEAQENPIIDIKFAEYMIIENIPNYLSKNGPYHECVEEARENKYLKDYRRWISDKHLNIQENEFKDIKSEVENSIAKCQNELFLKFLDPKTHYATVGKTIIGATVDIAIPGASLIYTTIEEMITSHMNKDKKWQGFIVSSRNFNSRV